MKKKCFIMFALVICLLNGCGKAEENAIDPKETHGSEQFDNTSSFFGTEFYYQIPRETTYSECLDIMNDKYGEDYNIFENHSTVFVTYENYLGFKQIKADVGYAYRENENELEDVEIYLTAMEGCKYSDDVIFELVEQKLMMSYGDGSKVVNHIHHQWETDDMTIEIQRVQDDLSIIHFIMK